MGTELSLEEQFEYARRAMNGDKEAWGVLYKKYFTKINREIYKNIKGGVKNSNEISLDLTSEVFEEIYTKLLNGDYNFKNSFFTFIWNFSAKWKVLKFWDEKDRYGVISYIEDNQNSEIKNYSPSSVYLPNSPDYWELFRLVCLSSAKPHQFMVFILNSVLDWKYESILTELNNNNLMKIAGIIKSEYLSAFDKDDDLSQYDKYFEPLFRMMARPVIEIYKENEYSLLINKYNIVGDIPLSEFSGDNATDKFSDWSYNTKILTWEKSLGFNDIENLLKAYSGKFEPHKVITCCLVKLLKKKKKFISNKMNNKTFTNLTDGFCVEYYNKFRNDGEIELFKDNLTPLYSVFNKNFNEIYTNKQYENDLVLKYKKIKTGLLTLEPFLNECETRTTRSSRNNCLKSWSDSVRNGVYNFIKKEKSKK